MNSSKLVLSSLALAVAAILRADAADKPEGRATPAETKRVRWATLPPAKQNTYRVKRMPANPTIDADWNKPAWKDIPPVTLEYFMGSEPSHEPKAQARLAYDDRALYLIWKVEDNHVLAKRTKHNQDVWCDTCVEFFFTPGGNPKERGYFNLETNCIGTKLFGIHTREHEDKRLTGSDFDGFTTASSLKGPIDLEKTGPTTWTLEYKIPLSVVEQYTKVDPPKPGVTWRANFYKCADDSTHPHWLTWSPVHNPEPSFHLPQSFGILTFE